MLCNVCQQEFSKGIGRSCSRLCHNRSINRARNYADPVFIANMRKSKNAEPVEKACVACGVLFTVYARTKTGPNSKRKFCSRKCAHTFNATTNLALLHTEKINAKRKETARRKIQQGQKWGFLDLTESDRADRLLKSQRHSSAGERIIRAALQQQDPEWKAHRKVGRKAVDLINHHLRVVVEYDGEWHFRKLHELHNFEQVKAKDQETEQWCTEHNYTLYRISENYFKRTLDSNVQLVVDDIECVFDGTDSVVKRYHQLDVC